MSAVSPYLDDVLARWSTQSADRQKELTFQKELLDPLTMAAQGNRLALRERRRRDLRQLEQSFQDIHARWNERLRRIEEWRRSVTALQSKETYVEDLLRASRWLQRARRRQHGFLARVQRRAMRFDDQQQAFHEALEQWRIGLEERADSLEELAQKLQDSIQPMFVSRARKQPEVDFAQEQSVIESDLGQQLHQIRASMRTALERMQNAAAAAERRTAGSEIFYEKDKQDLLDRLKEGRQVLIHRRDPILEDALLFESCRHLLRRLRDFANGLRCIEDLPQPPEPAWKSFLKIRT